MYKFEESSWSTSASSIYLHSLNMDDVLYFAASLLYFNATLKGMIAAICLI